MKLHSISASHSSMVVVFSDMSETRCVSCLIPNGTSQDAILQRIRNAFEHYNREVAAEAAA